MTETLTHGYSTESTLRKLSNEYHYDRVKMTFKSRCILVLSTKVALAFERLRFWSTNILRRNALVLKILPNSQYAFGQYSHEMYHGSHHGQNSAEIKGLSWGIGGDALSSSRIVTVPGGAPHSCWKLTRNPGTWSFDCVTHTMWSALVLYNLSL